MNEIEERNGLDPEVAESIRPTAEEVAQSATDMAESHVEPIESLPDSEDSSPLSKEEMVEVQKRISERKEDK